MNSQRLFVYGTLQRGQRNHHFLEEGARFLSRARVRGRLYDLGAYPGALLEAGSGWVWGELYALLPARKVLKRLDQLEGYLPADKSRSAFTRSLAEVDLGARKTLAWVYLYNGAVAETGLIGSGSWPVDSHFRPFRFTR